MRRIFILIVCAAMAIPSAAQSADEALVARLLGADDIAELDADEYERYARHLDHPVPINTATEATLSASGLFTPFQVASILDYRSSNGDILSAAELALIDGFNAERAAVLAPFLRFDGKIPGAAPSERFHADALLRWTPGVSLKQKYRLGYGERLSLAWSPTGSTYLSISGVRRPWRLILGDFKARFGQGLVLWNGFSMTGVTTLSAFAKTSSGIAPAWSWTEGTAQRGIAGEYRFGRWRAIAFASGDGRFGTDAPLALGGSLTRLMRQGQVSLTAYRKALTPARDGKAAKDGEAKFAADFFQGFGPVECYGEAAWDVLPRKFAAIGGLKARAGDRVQLAATARWYPSGYAAPSGGALRAGSKVADEAGLALGASYRSEKRVSAPAGSSPRLQTTLTLDLSGKSETSQAQLRIFSELSYQFNSFWQLQLRLQERLRRNYDTPPHRGELRADLRWNNGRLGSTTRLHAVRSEGFGWLCYQEAGYQDERWRLWLRGTLFFADSWQDRIYAYERDAPGGFSVPAFYKRGWKCSVYGGWRGRVFRRYRLALYLKASYLSYPWTSPAKDSKTELRLQGNLSF